MLAGTVMPKELSLRDVAAPLAWILQSSAASNTGRRSWGGALEMTRPEEVLSGWKSRGGMAVEIQAEIQWESKCIARVDCNKLNKRANNRTNTNASSKRKEAFGDWRVRDAQQES